MDFQPLREGPFLEVISKACSACGQTHEVKLSDSVMVCECARVMGRDLNAIINFNNKAVSSSVSAYGVDGSGRGSHIATKAACSEGGRFVYILSIGVGSSKRR